MVCVCSQNIRKGDFSRPKVTGKRAIELGAGMGLAGLAFAMIGEQAVLGGVVPCQCSSL